MPPKQASVKQSPKPTAAKAKAAPNLASMIDEIKIASVSTEEYSISDAVLEARKKDAKVQEYEKLRDSLNGYPYVDDLVRIIREMHVRQLDKDPRIKQDMKKFHDIIQHHFENRTIEGYPYTVKIVKEDDKCKKLWRKQTNEFFEVKEIKDFKNVQEDLYEPLGETHTAIVKFVLNSDVEKYVKKSQAEIIKICNESFASSNKYIYGCKGEIYCVFLDLKVTHGDKFTDFVTAKIHDRYMCFKKDETIDKKASYDKQRERMINLKTEFEKAGKNRKDHQSEYEVIIKMQIELEERVSDGGIYWSVGELERGILRTRIITPFSKSVDRVLLGKEFLSHYNGFCD